MVINIHRHYDFFLVEENIYKCIFGYYCKYCNGLCYQTLVDCMFFMISAVVIIYIATSPVTINIHRKYVLFSAVCWFIGGIEH